MSLTQNLIFSVMSVIDFIQTFTAWRCLFWRVLEVGIRVLEVAFYQENLLKVCILHCPLRIQEYKTVASISDSRSDIQHDSRMKRKRSLPFEHKVTLAFHTSLVLNILQL